MRCRKVRSYLSVYCREELGARRRLAVSDHLQNCPVCRQEEAAYRQLYESARVLPTPEVSADFNNRLLNRIAQERFAETRSKAYLPKAAPTLLWRKVVPAVATACLAVLVVINMIPRSDIAPARSADQGRRLDDSYLTVQPVSNPNMTVPLARDWSLSRQLARAERAGRISDAIIPASSFGGIDYHTMMRSGLSLTGQPIPYLISGYRMRPVVRIYVAPQTSPQKEGVQPY